MQTHFIVSGIQVEVVLLNTSLDWIQIILSKQITRFFGEFFSWQLYYYAPSFGFVAYSINYSREIGLSFIFI